MRLSVITAAIFLFTLQNWAAPAVSGFAVTTLGNGYSTDEGGMGKIVRYNITNGAVTDSVILYTRCAHRPVISYDGQKVAFMRTADTTATDFWYDKAGAVCVMNASGGTRTDLVAHIPKAYNQCLMEWPDGDWIYLGRTDSNTTNIGMTEIWKVNVSTKELVKVYTFTNGAVFGQWQMTRNGLASIVHDWTTTVGGNGIFRFNFADFANGNIAIAYADTTMINPPGSSGINGQGCGVGISCDGKYFMHLISASHDLVMIQRWNKMPADTLHLSAVAAGLAPQTIGMGTNINHFSANDTNWLCLAVGLPDRGTSQGNDMVIANWKTSEAVKITHVVASTGTKTFADYGDFWVNHATTAVRPVVTGAPMNTGAMGIYNMLGRKISGNGATLRDLSLKRGVYFVQVRKQGSIKMRKLVIQK
jgi:hypothetical protein